MNKAFLMNELVDKDVITILSDSEAVIDNIARRTGKES